MKRNFISSLFQGIQSDKNQAFTAIGSLIFGLIFVLMASAFIQYKEPKVSLPEHADRIFQVNKWVDKSDGERLPSTRTAGLLAPVLAKQAPEVEAATRVMYWPEEVNVSNFSRSVSTKRWTFVDQAFLHIFGSELLRGNAVTALNKPGQVVLTEATAKKLFGTIEVIGKPLIGLGGKNYTVSGVVKNPTRESVVQFDMLASWSSTTENSGLHDFRFMNNWIGQSVDTYVLLHHADQAEALEGRLPEVLRQFAPGQAGQYTFILQPVIDPGHKSGSVGSLDKSKLSEHSPVQRTTIMFLGIRISA